jgi:hypothetical protein
MWTADLFTITLVTGQVLRWTSADIPVTFGGSTWVNTGPKLTRTKWEIKNTLDIPEMDIVLSSTGTDYPPSGNQTQVILNPNDTVGGTLSNNSATFSISPFTLGGGLSRALYGRNSGKFYIEANISGEDFTLTGIGLCTSGATLSQIQNNAVNGVLFAQVTGAVATIYINGATGATGVLAAGPGTAIAVDLTNQLMWGRSVPTEFWNFNHLADPTAGIGGLSIPFAGVNIYPFATGGVSSVTQTVAVNLGQTAFVGTPPAGFAPGWPFQPVIGGGNIKALMAQGLFDGAIWELDRAFGIPVDGNNTLPTVIGTVNLFIGRQGQLEIGAVNTKVTVRAVSVLLQQYMPKNRFFQSCIHSFCDAGCTLSLQSFTASNTVGVGPNTTTNITQPANWVLPDGSNPPITDLIGGTLSILSGAGQGQSRTVVGGSTGSAGGFLTLTYPLSTLPSSGDLISCTQGCNKTLATGPTANCATYNNQQHYRGFPYVPPAESGL